jgi:integrase
MSSPDDNDNHHIDEYSTPGGQMRWRVRMRLAGRPRLNKTFTDFEAAQDWRDQQLILRRAQRRRSAPVLPELLGLVDPFPTNGNGNGDPRALATATVAHFIARHYWPQRAQKKLAPRTLNNYWRAFERFIEPSPLGQLALATVDAEDVLEWQEWCLDEAGASQEMMRTAQKVLSGAYTWGAKRPKRTGIWLHPVALAEWPEISRTLIPFIADQWTVERVRQAILHGSGRAWTRQRDALLLSLMALTGARPGDVLAVRLCDVRFQERELVLRHTKTKRPRTVPLFQPLADEIRAWVKTAGLSAESFLLAPETGAPMSFSGWERWRDRAYKPARNQVAKDPKDPDLAAARAYDLCRHSYAALQLAALMPLPDLAQIMGHSVAVLSSTYAGQLRRQDPSKPVEAEAEVIAARVAVSN